MYRNFFLKGFIFFSTFYISNTNAFTITRAIMSWDQNHTFDFFWDIVSKAWSELIGIKPTLIFLGPKNNNLNTSYGDIVYFPPISNIPTPFQAMAIRQLAAALFPDDVCIITDLDMLPVNKQYFENAVKDLPQDNFAVFYPKFHKDKPQYMMCYTAAKGSTYAAVFKIKNKTDIKIKLIYWYTNFYKYFGNPTDERMLYKYLHEWKDKNSRLNLLEIPLKRLDRPQWHLLDEKKVKNKMYADIHLQRPYLNHKNDIDKVLNLLKI